jgi:type II secretory pathway component PulJ
VSRRRGAFTLLEMIVVVMLTAIVLTVAIDFYRNLSRASQAAMVRAAGARRAAVLLDRVARDLEATVLLQKPKDVDPIAFPWIFLAEADSADAGADRLKFVTRGRRPRSPDLAESDLEMVVWMLVSGPGDGLELRRWSTPYLPDRLDRSFPAADDTQIVASGIAAFGIRLMGGDGEWVSRWDSSTLATSSELPLAAEIRVSFVGASDTDPPDGPYVRRVLLPLRPLDLEQQLAGGANAPPGGGQGQDQNGDQSSTDDGSGDQQAGQETGCVTVGQCLQRNPQLQSQLSGLQPEIQDVVQGSLGACASTFAGLIGGLPANCQ